MNAVNNLNELDRIKQISRLTWEGLVEYTDELATMTQEEIFDAVVDQPNLVAKAIKILCWRAGMIDKEIMEL